MNIVKLNKAGKLSTGFTPKTAVRSYYEDGTIPFIKPADISKDGKVSYDGQKLTAEGLKHGRLIPKYSVLMVCIGTVGKVCYVDRDVSCNQQINAVSLNSIIETKYIYYQMQTDYFQREAKNKSNQVTIPILNKSNWGEIPVIVPALEDQRQVVTELDTIFEKIELGIELTRKNINNIHALYASTFQTLMNDVLGIETLLSDVCEINTKLIDPRNVPYLTELHIGAANIATETGELINLKTAREEKLISGKFPFDDNTVLYSKIRPYLMKVARPNFPGICSADVYPLSTKDGLDKDYLFYLLLSPDFTQYAIAGSQRAGMPKVNRDHLFAYSFTLPDKAHQQEVVQKLDNLLKIKNLAIEKYKIKLDYLTSLKQSILNRSFNERDVK